MEPNEIFECDGATFAYAGRQGLCEYAWRRVATHCVLYYRLSDPGARWCPVADSPFLPWLHWTRPPARRPEASG